MVKKDERFEEKSVRAEKNLPQPNFLEQKMEAVKSSRLPEKEKEAYLARLTASEKSRPAANKMPFTAWASMRRIPRDKIKPMSVYPKARDVQMATAQEWDDIFSKF